MSYLTISIQVVQLLTQLFNLWKAGGHDVMKKALSDYHKQVCDERCQLDLKREAQKEL